MLPGGVHSYHKKQRNVLFSPFYLLPFPLAIVGRAVGHTRTNPSEPMHRWAHGLSKIVVTGVEDKP